MIKNVLLVGVGGQGTILAGKLLTLGLMEAGYDVKMSEIHGMSQRGGSVTTHIRYGDQKVYSPVIEKGDADIIVAFEKMEALRYLDYLKEDGHVVVNDIEIPGMPITSGNVEYPAGITEELKKHARTTVVNATQKALEVGSIKVMNVVLLGTIVAGMNLQHINWDKIITENVKPAFVELNKKALKTGEAML
jgi:indolepyruvate ferredoxin oxidoreductase beta subunit